MSEKFKVNEHTFSMMQLAKSVSVVRPFLSAGQREAMFTGARGQEKKFFIDKFISLANTIEMMPTTYGQDDLGDSSVAYLHYFNGSSDWFVTEKDKTNGVQQAFGYVVLNGDVDMAECGYFNIRELTANGVDLDLHFSHATLAEIKAQHA